ncbi:NADP-dependent oxidoreductase [Sphingomonas sp. BAUL-RG-20F-R05-02]|uniref:NADP-dependent oxidoreductase n=1 Tax=Sphingomonas sp. BAUL-RG-20F-R05-02 TaxID=2914830 RepID=UPI001F59AAF5|nr:NADP-dependent oxidoreductase [Sphingomonas sp. BAUL-RG-20F-R05-02]
MMKAFQLSGYKADPAFNEVDTPQPGTVEVLVRVACAALNPLDVKLRSGAIHGDFPLTFPATVGTDLSGTVEALGADVTGWTIGDRIVARTAPTSSGAMAEFARVPADQLVKLPDAIGFDDAAGIPTAAGTAWQALFEVAELKAGQTVLIHAGAGDVGSFAIQFARGAGARHRHGIRRGHRDRPITRCEHRD